MHASLFFHDNANYFAGSELRAMAREGIRATSLIRRAGCGDRRAAEALHIGFWPFVREFELAIDKQHLPRDPLQQRFANASRARVNQTFIELAKAVAAMKQEEGSHASHWKKDAQCLGLASLEGPPVVPSVQALIESSYSKDLPHFFSVLAGTEFVAEELSAYLTRQPAYLQQFSRKRWIWGEVHLIPHDDGPSHLEIDLDLARAYSEDDRSAKARIEAAIVETITLYARSANEIEAALVPIAESA
ncbi:MAG TPA: hypothetical protein PLP22_10120 [Candidatus Competibacter sp.]|nr:hypothetical protein [Candidatus Competibacteraceae bacterium]HRE55131.1 hypothetical protein [Candidatus Competibacter sp.]HUM95386.1 hypothetical protein [Candidatus Competibacter sp.]